MIHLYVLKFLWSDAVLSACYLINRMLSSVLNCTIPSFIFILTKVFFPWLFLDVCILFRTYFLI